MGIARNNGRGITGIALLACLKIAACGGEPSGGDGGDSSVPNDAGMDSASHGDGAVPDASMDGSSDGEAGMDGSSSSDAAADATSDAGREASIIEQALCPPEDQVAEGCMSVEGGEGVAGLCDGLDNDCNGRVDDGCLCTAGEVQRCFAGPPGRAGVGACAWGTQVCQGFEFPSWGACNGGVLPREEQCDGIDNDCNGCRDEIEACANLVDCPLAGDPRIGHPSPFSTHTFDADQFVDPALAKGYRWIVLGTPCDRLIKSVDSSASSTSGKLSYTLRGERTAKPELDVTLSGRYEVKLHIVLVTGEVVACEFPLDVGTRGLRVELCWPESGPNSPPSGEVDLDLHLGHEGDTQTWGDDKDCHWRNCPTLDQHVNLQLPDRGMWGQPNSPKAACTGPGVEDSVSQYAEACPNPRLDVDSFNVPDTRYPTENINLTRTPAAGRYRVAVVNRDCDGKNPCSGYVAHPLVNVYCDGELTGSFELAKGDVDTFGAGNGGDPASGLRDVWRVVDIDATRNTDGLDCDLTPLTNDAGTGPWIETGPDGGTLPY